MKYTLLVLPLLASIASAQDDVWKMLADGDRVQITFRSGNMIMGTLSHRPVDPRLKQAATDYSAVTELTVDVSLEYPGLNGTMTVFKKDIKEVRKIQSMDPTTMKRVREELQRIQQQASADEAARKSSEVERDKAAKADRDKFIKEEEQGKTDKEKGASVLKDLQDLQRGRELLQKFPPDKYGAKTISEMPDYALRKQPVPPDVREFASEEVQKLWKLALDAQAAEKKEKEAAKPKTEDKPKTEEKEKVEEKKQ